MSEAVIRFVIGGLVVSSFAVCGSVLLPKSFSGVFGAAPSVALATLALTIGTNGTAYAALEAQAMIAGAIAFFVYAQLVSYVMARYRVSAIACTGGAMLVWVAVAVSLHAVWFG